MTKPFDSFDEFANPIIRRQPEPKKVEVKEEAPATPTRGRRKKIEAPVDIPADVPAIEE